jgi:hypothetical protein
MNAVKCKDCGWIHFQVSAKYVHDWMREWVEFWISSPDSREAFGCKNHPPSPEQYLKCFRCGNEYKDFSKATKEELLKCTGSTLQPILGRREKI